MNTIQHALAQALPKELEAIRQQARKQEFEDAAKKGALLLAEATRATRSHDSAAALAAVRKDRRACACYLAKCLKCPVSAKNGRRSGFAELETMERFWREQLPSSAGAVA